jgi:hypothetical protein
MIPYYVYLVKNRSSVLSIRNVSIAFAVRSLHSNEICFSTRFFIVVSYPFGSQKSCLCFYNYRRMQLCVCLFVIYAVFLFLGIEFKKKSLDEDDDQVDVVL